MLSAATLATIQSTAPILAEHGESITKLFYSRLFAEHPELQNVFNMAHQAQGEQPRALAESVFMYATHIDALDKLGPMVSRIAHKHASLEVKPEHYPIVGHHLLEAIRDHLGLEPDDPVLEAWAEAYGQLAQLFIRTEADIFDANADKPGGWRGFRPFVVSETVEEAQGIRSLYLKPEDGGALAAFEPGQYVGVKVNVPGHAYDEIRQYSLSSAPGQDHYRITVKAEPAAPGPEGKVSNFLHRARPGDRVMLQPPTGDFILKSGEHPIVLIAGGVGITPLLSMLLHRIETGERVSDTVFVHCCRDADHHIMGESLRALARAHGFRYFVSYEKGEGADHTGYLDADVLSRWLATPDADVYCCGPKPFMSAVGTLVRQLGVDDARYHQETFGPASFVPAR